MVELVRIFEINLYVGFTEGVSECYEFIKYFRDNNIPYILLNYSNETGQHDATFNSLNTWRFGADGEHANFTDFPIVTWKEGFDDYSFLVQYSTSVEDFITRPPVMQKHLIK